MVRVCGFVPLVLGGPSSILGHGTEISNRQLMMLRCDSSRIMFIKYVTVAGKEVCFPESVCNDSCCGRFQVSFPNQFSNLIVCNNSVWMVFQPNLYLLCVVCLQRLHEGKSQRLQFMNVLRGKANNVHPVFPSTVSHLDIPQMRIVTIQCQGNWIFFRRLHKTDIMF